MRLQLFTLTKLNTLWNSDFSITPVKPIPNNYKFSKTFWYPQNNGLTLPERYNAEVRYCEVNVDDTYFISGDHYISVETGDKIKTHLLHPVSPGIY